MTFAGMLCYYVCGCVCACLRACVIVPMRMCASVMVCSFVVSLI